MLKDKTLLKICGITTVDQALQIAEFGVDAIGIISVKESPRYVTTEKKMEIFESLYKFFPKTQRVSVIQNLPLETIFENLSDYKYENAIQLHGEEDLNYCKKLKDYLPNLNLWKAFRIKNKIDIEKISLYEKFVDAVLLDSWNQDIYGGSGMRIKSEILKGLKIKKQWWLAGGVSIDWIEYILKDIKPDGIDISSSIEIYPGTKDIKKAEKIIKAIKK